AVPPPPPADLAPRDAPPPAAERETHPATPSALIASAPPPPEPDDPIALAARDMAKSAYDVAQHLGFEAMPDRARPSLRKLRIPLRNALEQHAAALLAAGAHPCVERVDLTRDQRSAITLVDLAVAPPS
ncbi:MAG: hypothetical protein M3Y87_27220, partial [Myxococcota bacterium]|nr:hypothetical protein [Myxococcota bacterium]